MSLLQLRKIQGGKNTGSNKINSHLTLCLRWIKTLTQKNCLEDTMHVHNMYNVLVKNVNYGIPVRVPMVD